MAELFAHQMPDVKGFAVLLPFANSIELISVAISKRFTFVTGPINISDQHIIMYKSQEMPCYISRIGSIPEKVPYNDESLGDLELFIARLFIFMVKLQIFRDICQ
ncbi:P-loop containing nucleoside triphosphate hydrolase protein [Gigaspora margarita]|uniref:P-loop containing nucleoside triphosphate hydrolase protein n=1 Tax=Gigaspora margarita TaxID=4874 RepID=A0A8H3X4Q7_GIGMA|nr:P-loop containing nucleoside triphosphate hydrolase protein [Gigaspora margarita]